MAFFCSPLMAEGFSAAAFEITSEEIEYDETLQLTDDVLKKYAVSMPSFKYDFNENTYSFYDQLDENNKASYNAMENYWTVPSGTEFVIKLPKTLSFQNSSSNIENWSEEDREAFWNAVLGSAYSAKNAFLFDHPEVFWVDESSIGMGCSSIKTSKKLFGGYTIKVSEVTLYWDIKEEYGDSENAEQCRLEVESALENFEVKGGDNYSKLKYIHDEIANAVVYNVNGEYRDSVYGFFSSSNKIVCEGYAKTMKLLCDRENIPCIVVVGNMNASTGVGHMWNYVRMEDDQWYGVDCTWDDTDLSYNPIKYTYFLKGSSGFKGHTPDTEYVTPEFTYPELCADDYVYNAQENTTAPSDMTETTESETEETSSETTVTAETSESGSGSTSVCTSETTSSATSSTEAASSALRGDYDSSGTIDVKDLNVLRDKLLGITEMDSWDNIFDMNEDSVVNIYDFIILKRIVERGMYT